MGRYGSGRNTQLKTEFDSQINAMLERMGSVSFDWFFISPVEKGYIKYNQLFDGSLTLYDIHVLNEMIEYLADVKINIEKLVEQRNGK